MIFVNQLPLLSTVYTAVTTPYVSCVISVTTTPLAVSKVVITYSNGRTVIISYPVRPRQPLRGDSQLQCRP